MKSISLEEMSIIQGTGWLDVFDGFCYVVGAADVGWFIGALAISGPAGVVFGVVSTGCLVYDGYRTFE